MVFYHQKIYLTLLIFDKAVPYAAEDADMTFRLYEIMRPKLVEGNVLSVYEDIDRPLIQVLMRMEERGILVDKHTLLMLSQNFATKIAALEKDIYALAGEVFTINSPMKLGEILFEKMKIEGGKKNAKTQNWITDQEVMESLAHCIKTRSRVNHYSFWSLKLFVRC